MASKPAYKWNKQTASTVRGYEKYYGFYVHNEEWTKLQNIINLRRKSYNLNTINFEKVASGTSFSATIFNRVVDAMNDFLKNDNLLPRVNSGDECTATLFNNLMIYFNDTSKHKY